MSIVQNIIDELKNQDIEVDYSQKLLIKKLCQIKFEKKRFLKFNIRKKILPQVCIFGARLAEEKH